MLVSSVSPTTNNTRTFEDTFDWYCQGFENYWYLGDSIPTLDAVRGKIVLRRRFAASRVPKGIDVTNWADNATFDILNAAALHVQDEYEVPTIFDIEAKATKVSNFLAKAATGESEEWYINYASGSSGGAYPNAVALGVAGTTAGVNADLSKALANYPVGTRLGTIPMDFPETPDNLLRQLIDLNGYSCLSIGDYDLMNTADQAFAFDYDGSGKLDHLVLYRPGGGAIYILKNSGGQFSAVYASGSGIGGYNLLSAADRAFAFDYDGSGKLDHLVLYRPGSGIIYIVRKEQFS